jgi:hypothetical protein
MKVKAPFFKAGRTGKRESLRERPHFKGWYKDFPGMIKPETEFFLQQAVNSGCNPFRASGLQFQGICPSTHS